MTGKRLYELLCDSWGAESTYTRQRDQSILGEDLPAWAFLHYREKWVFNRIAERLKGVRR